MSLQANFLRKSRWKNKIFQNFDLSKFFKISNTPPREAPIIRLSETENRFEICSVEKEEILITDLYIH